MPLKLASVRAMVDPKLQEYLSRPPGMGMSVIYAAVNVKDGKANVGKHCHGKAGGSVNRTRRYKHENPSPNDNSYFNCAMKKYGKNCFEWFILWHGLSINEDEMEKYWISPIGLHTIRDNNGGWGYNLKEGGDGGKLSASTIAKLKKVHNSDKTRKLHSIAGKKQFESKEAKDALSKRVKADWKNMDNDARFKRKRSISKGMELNGYKPTASKRAKAQIAREEAADPGCHRRRAKAQFARETPDQKTKRLAKSKAKTDSKREIRLAVLCPKERADACKRIEINQRSGNERKRRVHALKKHISELAEKKFNDIAAEVKKYHFAPVDSENPGGELMPILK